jgi:LacI family transcriptional regulator
LTYLKARRDTAAAEGKRVGRPTVNDLAKAAGVSLATVDRVLNARPGVRAATVARVTEAIDRIGYVRDVAAANLARQRRYRFVFALPEPQGEFAAALHAAVRRAAEIAALDRSAVELVPYPPGDQHALAALLDAQAALGADGVAVMAAETPPVRDAVRRLKAAGVAVAAVASDLPTSGRDHFAGVDNVAAGRAAGVLMGRFLGPAGGRVLVLAGSMRSREGIERRLGFDAALAERFPAVEALPSLEGRDDPDTVARVVAEALASFPGVAGVYAAGAGEAALTRALRAAGLSGRLVRIDHELTQAARAGLVSGEIDAVITQDVGHLARSAVRVLRALSDGAPIDPAQERIRIEIVIRETLPPA